MLNNSLKYLIKHSSNGVLKCQHFKLSEHCAYRKKCVQQYDIWMNYYKEKRWTEQIKAKVIHSIKFTFEILYSYFEIPQIGIKCFSGAAYLF